MCLEKETPAGDRSDNIQLNEGDVILQEIVRRMANMPQGPEGDRPRNNNRNRTGAPQDTAQVLAALDDLSSAYIGSIGEGHIGAVDGVLRRLPGQMERIRDDQVQNNAGGYVFAVSDEIRVRRFLILGCTGGTFYSTEKEITIDNIQAIMEIINKGKASMILRELLEISVAGRNPRQDPIMMALALCARYRVGDCQNVSETGAHGAEASVRAYAAYINSMHKAAFSILNQVCRIPTHLFSFVKYCEMISKQTATLGQNKSTGWGRGMRRAIQNWYASKAPEQLAMLVTKYKKRDGYSHRDLFRLAHPEPSGHSSDEVHKLEVEQIYRYVVKGDLRTRKRNLPQAEWDLEQPQAKYSAQQMDLEKESSALNLVESLVGLTAETPVGTVVEAIKKNGLVREHIPTEHLNSVEVWQALLEKMPMTALIRNLGKLTSIGALTESLVTKVVDQMTNEEELKKSRIHPLQILMAKMVYQSGAGMKGSLKWTKNEEVDTALETAFYKSFVNAPATGKRFCFAFDVSGSMGCMIANTGLSCRTAASALSLISLKNEKEVECVGFCHTLVELPYRGDWTIERISDHMDSLRFGSTDCALPMLWAAEKEKKFDVFVVYTDNETYFGDTHPFVALQKYREASGIRDARLIVMGMTASGFTIADPTDSGMLDIVGFDSAVPQLISDFVVGKV